jgi:hypothetical protein
MCIVRLVRAFARLQFVLCQIAALLWFPTPAVAQRDPTTLYARTTMNLGAGFARNVFNPNLPRDLVNHQNHPDDAVFLTGSPGTTVLEEIHVNTVQIQVGVIHPLGYSNMGFLANYVAEVPISFDGRVEQQQANDPRPPGNGSFIYTMLADVGIGHLFSTGLSFATRISEGENIWLETQGLLVVGRSTMTFEKGWSRFGQDQAAISSEASGLELSPKLTIAIRNARVGADLGLAYRQIRFSHDAETLEDHTARGLSLSFGARVSF